MKTKYDKWFEDAAADLVLRHAAIADLSRQRAILFGSASVITLCAAAIGFTTTRSVSAPALLSFAAGMSWGAFFYVDSRR